VAKPAIDPAPELDEPGTLGQLLYSDPTAHRTHESEWVALVDAIAARDAAALDALYQCTHRIVFTLIVRIVGDRASSEEVTLDVFHDVWRRAASYEAAGGTVLGWVMNQARSRAIDRVRFESRRKRVAPAEIADDGAHEHDASGDSIDRAHAGGRLRAALAGLTLDERAAIEAAYFSEMSYSEVAHSLDQPLGTIKTRIRSGLAKLRRALPAEDAT
jgi:RNA polymerase sigma-70 factor (ECF subfamily)